MKVCKNCEEAAKSRTPELNKAVEEAKIKAIAEQNWVAVYKVNGKYETAEFEAAVANNEEIIQVVTSLK